MQLLWWIRSFGSQVGFLSRLTKNWQTTSQKLHVKVCMFFWFKPRFMFNISNPTMLMTVTLLHGWICWMFTGFLFRLFLMYKSQWVERFIENLVCVAADSNLAEDDDLKEYMLNCSRFSFQATRGLPGVYKLYHWHLTQQDVDNTSRYRAIWIYLAWSRSCVATFSGN